MGGSQFMGKSISIDPITRIEGHLAIRLEIQDNRVAQAYSSGEMFRGFEVILAGRHPLDAQQITQRICGVCSNTRKAAAALLRRRFSPWTNLKDYFSYAAKINLHPGAFYAKASNFF